MREGGADDLLACWLWDGEAVEVPLAHCRGGRSALDASDDAEGPEVLQDEEDAQPPGVGVEYPFCWRGGGEVAGEEDALEHEHPGPGEADHHG